MEDRHRSRTEIMLRSGMILRIILGSRGWKIAAVAGGDGPVGAALASLRSTRAELRSRHSLAKMVKRRLERGLVSSR